MIKIQSQVSLASLTTFQIGGEARYMAEVKNEAEIREAIEWAKEQGVPFRILAGGSNVLVPDNGFDGLVIHVVPGEHSLADGVLTADAGCNLLALIREAATQGWGGWEKMAGIPGTIGGAVRGNAGAFGTEIKDFLVFAQAFDINTIASDKYYTTPEKVETTFPTFRVFSNEECEFAYRQSFFKNHPEWIITKVVVQLRRVDPVESSRLIEATIAEREKRHLQNVRAAGSYFMNPVAPADIVLQFEAEKGVASRENRVPAGWLIEKTGMKGFAVGGASASMQHPNYIVSDGTATEADVRAVAAAVIAGVKEQFGIELREEAVVW